MHISNGSSEALSAAFLLWDQPGALDADVLTTNEILVIVILWISILQTAPNILLSHSRGVFHLVWLTEFVLIPLFFAFKLVTWLKKNKTFWPIFSIVCSKNVFSSYFLQWHVKWYGRIFFLTWGNWDLVSMSERSTYLPKSCARPTNQHWLETYFDSLGHLVNLKGKK